MNELGELMQSYADLHQLNQLEGTQETAISNVYFYRSSTDTARQPLIYQSGIIVLGQGRKDIHIGEQVVHYGSGDCLVVGVPMPLECEAFAEDGEPLLGLSIHVDSTLLHRLVNELSEMNFSSSIHYKQDNFGLSSVRMAQDMRESCKRLLLALHNRLDSKILGDSLVMEIVYRVLTGPEGHVLFNLAHHDGQYARIAKALNKMHQSYSEGLTVQALAEEAHMSVSAFHSAFRKVTLESPLQYLKKVRLNKAKELIQLEGLRANEAAHMVGYTSSSQFSREFKRHFSITPKMAV